MKLFGLYFIINMLLIVVIAFPENLMIRAAVGFEAFLLFLLNLKLLKKDL